MASFYVQNFGCRATQADGAAVERQFEEQGLERAAAITDAAIVVLNTCTVTASADQDARAAIRRVHRDNPQARIIVTGCYAQRSPEELMSLPGVAQIVGNSHKHRLAEIALTEHRNWSTLPRRAAHPAFVPINTLTDSARQRPHLACPELSEGTKDQRLAFDRSIFVSDIFAHTELLAAPVFDAPNERTRPNLKIQDGCDNRCSFCVIPFVRGHSRSLRLEQVVREVNSLVASGYREVVISGINLGRWGRDLEGRSQETGHNLQATRVRSQVSGLRSQVLGGDRRPFLACTEPSERSEDFSFVLLLRAILANTAIEKLRISSVEPMDWSDELIALVANSPRIAKHAHVPMQSGSDAVLRRMHRKYRPWHYREKIEKIRAALPTAAIGADVMVGFPGETEAEFNQTRRMIEDLPFTYLHVFTFSARPGTAAAGMTGQVPVPVARERSRVLRELGEAKKLAFMRGCLGSDLQAITLARGSDISPDTPQLFTDALTDNYLKMRLAGRFNPNQWINAQIIDVKDGYLVAAKCDPEASPHPSKSTSCSKSTNPGFRQGFWTTEVKIS